MSSNVNYRELEILLPRSRAIQPYYSLAVSSIAIGRMINPTLSNPLMALECDDQEYDDQEHEHGERLSLLPTIV
jgi:hypothetical protein